MPAADAAVLLPGWHPRRSRRARHPRPDHHPLPGCRARHAEAILVRRARISRRETGDAPPGGTPGRARAVLIAAPSRAASPRLRGVLESGLPPAWPRSCSATGHPAPPATSPPTAPWHSADPALDGIQLFHLGDADTTAVISLLQAACAEPPPATIPAPAPGRLIPAR